MSLMLTLTVTGWCRCFHGGGWWEATGNLKYVRMLASLQLVIKCYHKLLQSMSHWIFLESEAIIYNIINFFLLFNNYQIYKDNIIMNNNNNNNKISKIIKFDLKFKINYVSTLIHGNRNIIIIINLLQYSLISLMFSDTNPT